MVGYSVGADPRDAPVVQIVLVIIPFLAAVRLAPNGFQGQSRKERDFMVL
jgi:hypothetical protein